MGFQCLKNLIGLFSITIAGLFAATAFAGNISSFEEVKSSLERHASMVLTFRANGEIVRLNIKPDRSLNLAVESRDANSDQTSFQKIQLAQGGAHGEKISFVGAADVNFTREAIEIFYFEGGRIKSHTFSWGDLGTSSIPSHIVGKKVSSNRGEPLSFRQRSIDKPIGKSFSNDGMIHDVQYLAENPLWSNEKGKVVLDGNGFSFIASEISSYPSALYHWTTIDNLNRWDSDFPKSSDELPEFPPIYGGKNMRSLYSQFRGHRFGENLRGIYANPNLLGFLGGMNEVYGDLLVKFRIKPGQRVLRIKFSPEANLSGKPHSAQVRQFIEKVSSDYFDLIYFEGAITEWIVLSPDAVESVTADPRELRAEIEGAKNLILNSSGDIHIAKGHGHAWLPTFDIEQRGLKEKVISDLNFFRSFSNAELKQSFGRNFRPAGRVDDFQKSYFWHLAKRVGIYESLMEKPELIEELIPSRFRRGGFSKDCGSLLSSN
ncbi:MAG TPA: hypothetical protein DCL41_06930 [Bdellovibrionales bacterium]|nr:hypothetical protein [Pseudobdellovibrionaceae bacterium]HAG91587.1 hypothetical protein [Bdellovibrionales bacterium]|tara:strand:+ start:2110 stop:3576 length:1467 start_codon:yes stop_codon:yes gene_type:complete